MDCQDVMVTICCITYNHEQYIREALESFVNQKTSFRYNIIIHDDASTDNTVNIIKEYCDKYPNIIIPVLQTENQYSKGVRIISQIIEPLVKSKYVAFCEGDDYWCDKNKLEEQITFLEKNNEYVACVHNTYLLNTKTGKKYQMFRNVDVSTENIIRSNKMQYHISSLVYRSELLHNEAMFVNTIQSVSDYPLSIFLSLSGKINFINENMSVYRYATDGSWTIRNNDLSRQKKNLIEKIEMLELANDYSCGEYDVFFYEAILKTRFKLYAISGDFKEISSSKYDSIWKEMKLSTRLMYKLGAMCPKVFVIKQKILG